MIAVLVQLGGEKGKVKEEKRKKRKEEREENESGGSITTLGQHGLTKSK